MRWTISRSWWLLKASLTTFLTTCCTTFLRARVDAIVLAWIILRSWSTRSRSRWLRHLNNSSSSTAPIEFSITRGLSICQWVITLGRTECHCRTTALHLRCLLRVWSQSTCLRMMSCPCQWEETQSVHFVASQAPSPAIDGDDRRRSRVHVYVINIQMSFGLIRDSPSISCPSVRGDITASETMSNLIKSAFYSQVPTSSRFTDTIITWAMWAMSCSTTSWALMKK